jgi:hypothetical protein
VPSPASHQRFGLVTAGGMTPRMTASASECSHRTAGAFRSGAPARSADHPARCVPLAFVPPPPPPRGSYPPHQRTRTRRSIRCAGPRPMWAGTARAWWAAPRAEERVAQERRKPCPSDILGTWSRHGNPGDSRFLPSVSPLRSWQPWSPRPPWSPATRHRQRRPGRPAAHTRRSHPGRRRHRRRPPPRARASRAPHAPRRPPSRTPPRSPNPPPAGHQPRLAARRPPGP